MQLTGSKPGVDADGDDVVLRDGGAHLLDNVAVIAGDLLAHVAVDLRLVEQMTRRRVSFRHVRSSGARVCKRGRWLSRNFTLPSQGMCAMGGRVDGTCAEADTGSVGSCRAHVAIAVAALLGACATSTDAIDAASDARTSDAGPDAQDAPFVVFDGHGGPWDAWAEPADAWVDPNLLRLVWPPSGGRMLLTDESLVIHGGIAPIVDVCTDAACASAAPSTPSADGVVTPMPALAPGRYWWRAHDSIGQRTETRPFIVLASMAFPPRARPRFDVDGDGLGDAAACLYAAGHWHLLVWTMGALGAPIDRGATGDACLNPVDVGDVDGDGRSDVGDLGNTIRLGDARAPLVATLSVGSLRGAPFPTWQSGASPVGDIDGDGLDDLVVTSFGGVAHPCWAAVFFGDPTLVGARQLAIGSTLCDYGLHDLGNVAPLGVDIDANGSMDVVVPTDETRTSLSVLSPGGDGLPLFTIDSPDGPHTGFGYRFAPGGDLDADGAPDLVVVQLGPPGLRVVSWNGRVSGLVPVPLDGHERIEALGDFDGDGFDDVAIGSNPGAFLVFGGASVPTVVPIVTDRVGFTEIYDVLAPGDVTGDGRPDLFVSDLPGHHVALVAGGGRDVASRITTLMGLTGVDTRLASR